MSLKPKVRIRKYGEFQYTITITTMDNRMVVKETTRTAPHQVMVRVSHKRRGVICPETGGYYPDEETHQNLSHITAHPKCGKEGKYDRL